MLWLISDASPGLEGVSHLLGVHEALIAPHTAGVARQLCQEGSVTSDSGFLPMAAQLSCCQGDETWQSSFPSLPFIVGLQAVLNWGAKHPV